MAKLNIPCYDVATKTDCPNRSVGCQTICPKWAEYLEKRNAKYKAQDEERKIMDIREQNKLNMNRVKANKYARKYYEKYRKK